MTSTAGRRPFAWLGAGALGAGVCWAALAGAGVAAADSAAAGDATASATRGSVSAGVSSAARSSGAATARRQSGSASTVASARSAVAAARPAAVVNPGSARRASLGSARPVPALKPTLSSLPVESVVAQFQTQLAHSFHDAREWVHKSLPGPVGGAVNDALFLVRRLVMPTGADVGMFGTASCMASGDCSGKDLTGVQLDCQNLGGVDWSGANLSSLNLSRQNEYAKGGEIKKMPWRAASGGSPSNRRDAAGLDDYSNYNAKKNSKIVDIPGVGEILTFWDHDNKRVVVSDEGYWNPKSPTGDKLAKAVEWARNQGYQAGVVVTPYASDRFGDGVSTTAGGHTRSMPGATDQQLRDYIDAADFVLTDPYLVSAASATPETQDKFAAFTKDIGDYANSKGKDTWLYLQGFSTPDVDAKVVEDYNTRIATENAGRYNDVSFFNISDFGHAGNPNEDHTGFSQINTQGTVDAVAKAVEPWKMAEKGGFDLPSDWANYDPAGKIDYFNARNIDAETLRNVGVPQEDIDWMASRGFVGDSQPEQLQPLRG